VTLVSACECILTRTTAEGTVEVLLGLKKRGTIGKGKIVGPGGHVEAGETDLEACVRELEEETGLVVDPAELRDAGTVVFRFPTRPEWDMSVAVFTGERFTGELVETDELAPAWYPVAALPFDRMWDDAKYWLPRVLAGTVVRAEIALAEDCETAAEVQLHEG
jgi:8-oxo-dGTP diphosphatase